MNDDELKRAALAGPAVEPLAHINSNGVVHAVGYPWEAGEVLTPLYASPPPPAKPAVEPFGYFRAEPFGWTDCAPTDEGAKALYEVPPAAAPPLTDEAIAETMANVWGCASIAPRQAPEFARAIERLIKGVRL